jgi:protein-S-isoprenylcysteine O-methyltransferase Ste14
MAVGLFVGLPGEVLRVWAAGHIHKGSEITRSGPYRVIRHPLYLGSTILGAGFVIAARSAIVAVLVAAYLGLTLLAATRTEEAALDQRFGGAYSDYREGRSAGESRPFTWERVRANREYRAVAGLAVAAAILYWRSRM